VEFIGIDLLKLESQICILNDRGEVVLEERINSGRRRNQASFFT